MYLISVFGAESRDINFDDFHILISRIIITSMVSVLDSWFYYLG